jgi:hypothetical protein
LTPAVQSGVKPLHPAPAAPLQLRAELGHKFDEEAGIMLRHLSSVGLHGFRQAQEFALEMVEGIFAVIQRPPVSKGSSASNKMVFRAPATAKTRARPIAPSDSRRSASWTIFASSVRGGIAALKLCASMAWLTAA